MAGKIPRKMSMGESPIIFFDGVCNLCNRSVQVILKNDKKNIFFFSSLQSDFAAEFFQEHNYKIRSDSIIFFNGKQFHEKSGAALRIAARLKFPFPLLGAGWILPPFIRNAVYGLIAKKRYSWFGRTESCMIPNPELSSRFLM
ncbi:MAG: thiol-disulfide oxidoreductase DCC family protein [Chitinophagales bacterium]